MAYLIRGIRVSTSVQYLAQAALASIESREMHGSAPGLQDTAASGAGNREKQVTVTNADRSTFHVPGFNCGQSGTYSVLNVEVGLSIEQLPASLDLVMPARNVDWCPAILHNSVY